MKKIFFVCFFLLAASVTFAQSITEIDEWAKEWCLELKNTDSKSSAKERLLVAFEKSVVPHLQKYDSASFENIREKIFYRIQRIRCKIFFEITEEMNSYSSQNFSHSNERPKSLIDKVESEDFKTRKVFYYKENNGTTTKVILNSKRWRSIFADGTYALYELQWLSTTEFRISYLRSNNEGRAAINLKGDSYHYILLQKNADSFRLAEYVPNTHYYSIFKMYFIKQK